MQNDGDMIEFDDKDALDPVTAQVALTKAEAMALYAMMLRSFALHEKPVDAQALLDAASIYSIALVGLKHLGIRPDDLFDKLTAVFNREGQNNV